MVGSINTEELLNRLDEQHKAYLETFRLVHDALSHNVAANLTLGSPAATPRRRRRSTLEHDGERSPPRITAPTHRSNESDFSDEDEGLYVQDILPSYKFDSQHLREHLRRYQFNAEGRKALESVIDDRGRLKNPDSLFPEVLPDHSHTSHYSVLDVGTDGAPVSRRAVVSDGSNIDYAIWQAIQDLNANPSSQRPAVGRISIIREPNPIILGALHLTMNQHIDMDEVFKLLVSSDASAAHMTDRAFSDDERQQRSFVFNFDYYTVIGETCSPMAWQLTDIIPKKKAEHIPISKCSSVVVLSLSGKYIRKLKNARRRAKTQEGYIYDPWAPWHVLNIQCYPDHKHSMDSHDSTKHYVNGPEAFLTTLLAEFKDSQKRFEDIYNRISKLVTPPPEFMFSRVLRDKLLFEDAEFTYSRRYFWAFQTLGMMNNAIKAIIDSYEDTFTDDVWEGRHKSLWPMLDPDSARNIYWRKRMLGLKKEFEKEVKGLQKLWDENDDMRKEIRTLRDQLFSGTSVQESRKNFDMAVVTILQGRNIKVLTLVSIFFLPLTFVTSVFGMTNLQSSHWREWFAIVMVTICVPFFFIVGSLNTTSGIEFWGKKWKRLGSWVANFKRSKTPSRGTDDGNGGSGEFSGVQTRSLSTSEAIMRRQALLRPIDDMTSREPRQRAATTTPNARLDGNVLINGTAVKDSDSSHGVEITEGTTQNGASGKVSSLARPSLYEKSSSRLGKLWGRKRNDVDLDHNV